MVDIMNEIIIFDNRINLRYQTVLKNIKTISNSFYDSFLDLLEETIKYILDEDNIEYKKENTCGGIIKSKNIEEYLINTLKLDIYTFEKLPDYIKKCNDHKHKKEKTLSLESVVNYLKVYFNLVNSFCSYKNINKITYDERYFIDIFGETELLNIKYKKEVNDLKSELEIAYQNNKIREEDFNKCRNLLSISELAKFSLEEQNILILSQIELLSSIKLNNSLYEKLETLEQTNNEILNKLKQNEVPQRTISNNDFYNEIEEFVRRSEKKVIWMDDTNFEKNKIIVLIMGIIILITGFIQTVLLTKAIGFYSTFSLFENIWMFLTLLIIIYNFKHKKIMDPYKLSISSTFIFELNSYGVWENTLDEKKRYKVFRILAYISCVLNIIYSINTSISPWYYLISIIFLVCTKLLSIFKEIINSGYYGIISFTGKQLKSNNIVTIYYLIILKKFMSDEEFKEFKKNHKNCF